MAILSTDPKGIEGSLPSKIDADGSYDHSTTLTPADAVSLTGEKLAQDPERISVVAAIIDSRTGDIVNCTKGKPGVSGTGIVTGDEVVETEYYNLQGIRIEAPEKGRVAIMVTTHADGSRKVKKVM